MDSRSNAELRYWYPFRLTGFLQRLAKAQQAEEDDREAWLAGVQKRLGLVTRPDVDELLMTRHAALGRSMWPS